MGTVADKLTYLGETKQAIRAEANRLLSAQGKDEIAEGDSFRSYAEKLSNVEAVNGDGVDFTEAADNAYAFISSLSQNDSQVLEDWLQESSNMMSYNQYILGVEKRASDIASLFGPINAICRSPTAASSAVNNEIFREKLLANGVSVEAVMNNNPSMSALASSRVAMNSLATSQLALDSLKNSQNAKYVLNDKTINHAAGGFIGDGNSTPVFERPSGFYLQSFVHDKNSTNSGWARIWIDFGGGEIKEFYSSERKLYVKVERVVFRIYHQHRFNNTGIDELLAYTWEN